MRPMPEDEKSLQSHPRTFHRLGSAFREPVNLGVLVVGLAASLVLSNPLVMIVVGVLEAGYLL